MAKHTWSGYDGDWSDPAKWTGDQDGIPRPGDAATIAGGDAYMFGAEGLDGSAYDAVSLTLGDAGNDPTSLELSDAYLGRFFSVDVKGSATIASDGVSAVVAPVVVRGDGTVLDLAGDPSVANGLQLSGRTTIRRGATLHLEGKLTAEAGASVTARAGSDMINDAAVTVIGSSVDVKSALRGTGSFTLGIASTLNAEGSVSAGQTIRFGDVDGTLEIADPNAFGGSIQQFRSGDVIDVTSVVATSADYDAATQILSLRDASGATLAAVHDVEADPGELTVEDDRQGGTAIAYAGAVPSAALRLEGGDRAIRGDVARAINLVPTTGEALTGNGVKVGIISNSFDASAPGSADEDASAGYLPANPDGTSAVSVLKEGQSSSDDEGRAMAELVHRVAPGADIYFAAANSQADLADAVGRLQAEGCQIIVDDKAFDSGAFYQVAGPAALAEAAAVQAGINVFTSAGNIGRAYLELPFAAHPVTLPDGNSANAEVFDDGTSYETITVPSRSGAALDLQWTAPFEGLNDEGAPTALGLKVFDVEGNLVGTGQVQTLDGVRTTDVRVVLQGGEDRPTDYRVAVTLNGRQVSPTAFKLILSAQGGTGTGPGGYFHDSEAGQGSGDITAQGLVPDTNTVGESYFGNSSAFGLDPTYNISSSAQGPGTLLYDERGNMLPQAQQAGKVDFDAPTGLGTSVTGFETFYGTSAAAPMAAGVAALMLQANSRLSPTQVSDILADTSIDQGLTAAQQGAGLVQADAAVAEAISVGQQTADAVSMNTEPSPDGAGGLVFTGHASAPAGVANVEITALIDGTRQDLGSATLDADGAFVFNDQVGPDEQSFITATMTDGDGGYRQANAPFSLTGRQASCFAASATEYDEAGDSVVSTTGFRKDGSRVVTVQASGRTFASAFFDTFLNAGAPGNTFVFDPGHGLDVVEQFRAGGTDHDLLSFVASDFGASFAEVLRNTANTAQGAVVTDPSSGDTVLLSGVTKAQLRGNPSDVVFHS